MSYTTNYLIVNTTKNIIPFAIAKKKIKNIGINLTKNLQNLHTENHGAAVTVREGRRTGGTGHSQITRLGP